MCKPYIIGVDGGNTKTDYFLFDLEGNFISSIRAGTCSHESLPDSYEGTYNEMKKRINQLLSKENLTLDDIELGVFGLAGLDVPKQKEKLDEVIRKIGFTNFVAENDGYLGLKAGSKTGAGICSINGTGTVTTGIDQNGNRLQIGGVGYIAGDDAGGAFITRELLRQVHNALYRCGKDSSLVEPTLKLLGVEDKIYYIQAISELYRARFSHTPYVKLVFEHADNGDELALEIIDKVAEALARSTAGCINNLNFHKDKKVEIILAGSVWVKPDTTILIDAYKEYVEEFTSYQCEYIILQVPPGIGAVLWALELAHRRPVDEEVKKRIIREMSVLL
ncbi:MAG: N-acetylglucosamine kinase [Epulopiscium sp.]|nr:N-acetylglucosamine kinase [Candidatus Epulonipiscium sp.]